jgi:hypothetical protein
VEEEGVTLNDVEIKGRSRLAKMAWIALALVGGVAFFWLVVLPTFRSRRDEAGL